MTRKKRTVTITISEDAAWEFATSGWSGPEFLELNGACMAALDALDPVKFRKWLAGDTWNVPA